MAFKINKRDLLKNNKGKTRKKRRTSLNHQTELDLTFKRRGGGSRNAGRSSPYQSRLRSSVPGCARRRRSKPPRQAPGPSTQTHTPPAPESNSQPFCNSKLSQQSNLELSLVLRNLSSEPCFLFPALFFCSIKEAQKEGQT